MEYQVASNCCCGLCLSMPHSKHVTLLFESVQKLTNGISTSKGNESINEMKCKMERCVQ